LTYFFRLPLGQGKAEKDWNLVFGIFIFLVLSSFLFSLLSSLYSIIL